MGLLPVVMPGVDAKNVLELAAADDQEPVEALATDGSDPALHVRVPAFIFLIRPLRQLERAAGAVGDGDLAMRAPENEGPPEVRSLAAVFNETVARLEQLLRSRANSWPTPPISCGPRLTSLRLRLENLERDLAEPGRRDLEGALEELDRLARLVDGLLILARADADAARRRVDLTALVSDAWPHGRRGPATSMSRCRRERVAAVRCAPRRTGYARCSTT